MTAVPYLFRRFVRYLSSWAWKREMESEQILEWIQRSPNPRLRMCDTAWRQGVGGVTLRSSFLYVMKTSPDAGFLPSNTKTKT